MEKGHPRYLTAVILIKIKNAARDDQCRPMPVAWRIL